MTELLDQKLSLYVPMLYDCDLSIGNRLILAYGLYQRKFHSDPSVTSYHNHTGIARATITAALAELDARDWWTRHTTYGRTASNKFGYQYFNCYIHQPGQPQTVASIALWSLLRHMGQGGYKCLYNYAYFTSSLGFANGTSKNCLESLRADRWLDYTVVGEGRKQRLNFTRYKLTESQLSALKDKAAKPVDEFSDNSLAEAPPLQESKASVTIHSQDGGNHDQIKDNVEEVLEYIKNKSGFSHEEHAVIERSLYRIRDGGQCYHPRERWDGYIAGYDVHFRQRR